MDGEAFTGNNVFGIGFKGNTTVASGFKLVDFELNCLDEQKRGLRTMIVRGSSVFLPTRSRNLKQVDGVLTDILEDENGVRFRVPFPVHILPPSFNWDEGFEQKTDDATFKVVDGVLVCTITNDSAKMLSVSCKSIRGSVALASVDSFVLFSDGSDVDKGVDIQRNGGNDNIEIEIDKSLKGCEAFVRVGGVDCETYSDLWMYFE